MIQINNLYSAKINTNHGALPPWSQYGATNATNMSSQLLSLVSTLAEVS